MVFTTLVAFSTLLATYGAYALPTNSTLLLEQRAPLAAVYTKCSKANTVAITFGTSLASSDSSAAAKTLRVSDDGPYNYNADIVNTLNKNGAKGTFFVNGNNYQSITSAANVQRLKAAYGAGHQIASHTWAHKDLNTLSKAQCVFSTFPLSYDRHLICIPV